MLYRFKELILVSFCCSAGFVYCSAADLTIWNLLSNAIKFTPKDSRGQIKHQRINSHIKFLVADNGQGTEAEVLPFIFERFRQSDSSTTRMNGGLGLWLAIVRRLEKIKFTEDFSQNKSADKSSVLCK